MVGRSISRYTDVFPPLRLRQPDLVYEGMTVLEASLILVNLGKVDKSLGWIARNMPQKLEDLMDQLEPGSRAFWGLCLIYEAHEKRIKGSVERRNRKCQAGTIAGLATARKRR